LGIEDGDNVEILSGLKSGDIVVINGPYLINSEYIFKRGSLPIERFAKKMK
jgi:Cu(I)/Ag(I) efflux system membrane fusion protein